MSKYLVDIKEVADGQETDNEYVFKASNILMSDNTDVETAITNKPGEKYLVGNVPKGEIFNDYTNNKAPGDYSHSEGRNTTASGNCSHAEGENTVSSGETGSSHAEGSSTTASGAYGSHAEGASTTASGTSSHAEGVSTEAVGHSSHAEGNTTKAYGRGSHAEGEDTVAGTSEGSPNITYAAHAEGYGAEAIGKASHAEGGFRNSVDTADLVNKTYTSTEIPSLVDDTITVSGPKSHGLQSHAEGTQTLAYAYSSHAEGYQTLASGNYSHAEGDTTITSGDSSHAEGCRTTASGDYGSHAEGCRTSASGNYSHAEGYDTVASGISSHAEGRSTIASGKYSHVEGKYNVEDTEDKYAHITGGGSNTNRRNIYTLDWEGNATFAGGVTCTNHLYESRSPALMGIVDADTLDDIVEKIPSGTLTTIWINGTTNYGQEVRNGIGSSLNVYGNMFVYKTKIDGTSSTTTHFVLMSYTSSYIFIRSYSTVNSSGWSVWKRLTLTDV